MPSSHLRRQLDVQSTRSFYPHPSPKASSSSPSPQPSPLKPKMSLSQTYRVASTARGKLGSEASRPDHNLRLLVGHANLLDSLMLELAHAEREQEAWFNDSIRHSHRGEAPKHIQWFDSIAEESDAPAAAAAGGDVFYDDSEESDDSDDSDEFDVRDFAVPPRRRSVSPPPALSLPRYDDEDEDEDEVDDDDDEDDDDQVEDYDEDEEELALTRSPSHSTPDLVHEDSEDSDDDATPPSPPHTTFEFARKPSSADDDMPLFSPSSPSPSGAVSHLKTDLATQDFLHSSSSPAVISAY